MYFFCDVFVELSEFDVFFGVKFCEVYVKNFEIEGIFFEI